MDKLKYIKFEESQRQYTNSIPIGVDSKNVDLKTGYNLEQTLGDYDLSQGTIEDRLELISQIKNPKLEVWKNVANYIDSDELTSDNISTAILSALEDGPYIYIPAGNYTFNISISTDCTILLDKDAYISTNTIIPCIEAIGCSFSLIGGNIYSGQDTNNRYYLGWPEGGRKKRTIIRLTNCHDCKFLNINSPYHNSLSVFYLDDTQNVIFENCNFDKILNSAIFLNHHCVNTIIRNCVFKNSRYAMDPDGTPRYYCYFVYTGTFSFNDYFYPCDGLIYENNYCQNSEDCGLDTHGASNVIIRNNIVNETVCAITAYNDNQRVVRPSDWNMNNIIIQNNYCKSSKNNNPNTSYPHPFIFLGATYSKSIIDDDNQGAAAKYNAFQNCFVRNNTFISDTDNQRGVYLDQISYGINITNNYMEFKNATYAIEGYHAINITIESNTFSKNGTPLANINSNASGKILGNVGMRLVGNSSYKFLQHFEGGEMGSKLGYNPSTTVKFGENARFTSSTYSYTSQIYGISILGRYTGEKQFSVTITDGICYLPKHDFIPSLSLTMIDVDNTSTFCYVTEIIDRDHFLVRYGSSFAKFPSGEYTCVLREATNYDNIHEYLRPLILDQVSNNVNMRETPSSQGTVVASLPKNSIVLALSDTKNNYYPVIAIVNGEFINGYVYASYGTFIA